MIFKPASSQSKSAFWHTENVIERDDKAYVRDSLVWTDASNYILRTKVIPSVTSETYEIYSSFGPGTIVLSADMEMPYETSLTLPG